MSDSWKQWEGQVVDGKFPLHRYLGGSEHSAVFLTERGAPPQKVAIKFVQVDEPDAEIQLFRWQHAAKLSHPHLLRTFECGRCHLGEFDLLYVLMELAEENLSQFLPQRPLTPAEARDVLTPALQALAFLHGEGLVHGHLRPSNILAIDDQLKLSTDGISSVADHAEQSHLPAHSPADLAAAGAEQLPVASSQRHASPYDPPEAAKGVVAPAGDIWSLGMTIVEALTQNLPAANGGYDPVVPDTLPALFLDIARHCLNRDADRRWTVVEIGARLNPGSITPSVSAASPVAPSGARAATATAPAIIPLGAQQTPAAVAMASERKDPAYSLPAAVAAKAPSHTQTVAVRGTAARPRYDLVQPHLQRPPLLPPLPKLNYVPLGIVVGLALLAIFVGPRLLHRRANPAQPAAVAEAPSRAPAVKPVSPAHATKNAGKSAQKPAQAAANSAPPAQHVAQTAPPAASSLQKTSEKRTVNSAPPAALNVADTRPSEAVANPVAAGPVMHGEVLEQIMPEVSAKARATIRGTVHVTVKLHVDPSGNVASAELSSPGPSKYFADQALQAAHRWDFAPAKVAGHAVASDWMVRFEFTPALTKAHPTQSSP